MVIPQKQTKWDNRFMALCEHISHWTEDRYVNVGAVIVGPALEIRSTGYNGFARGVKAEDDARHNRENAENLFWFEHAERNAIYNAARMGVEVAGCTLYVNRFPCADCGRAIIQSGIIRVYCPPIPEFDGALDYSFSVSMTMLEEAGIPITFHEYK